MGAGKEMLWDWGLGLQNTYISNYTDKKYGSFVKFSVYSLRFWNDVRKNPEGINTSFIGLMNSYSGMGLDAKDESLQEEEKKEGGN